MSDRPQLTRHALHRARTRFGWGRGEARAALYAARELPETLRKLWDLTWTQRGARSYQKPRPKHSTLSAIYIGRDPRSSLPVLWLVVEDYVVTVIREEHRGWGRLLSEHLEGQEVVKPGSRSRRHLPPDEASEDQGEGEDESHDEGEDPEGDP